ncbi:hypothetical protein [Dyella lutea]|uniref:Multidrug efflux pump subunit AcrA (Membrane-fusion protein) n=1 Tax=Dyella lutea TaxID=2950441 RepID=A0ABT1FE14_9GAMM|nr:hypothetical protein [Dyella lutea]MCP1375623.1 hypothetical protein [Dyella lutea]
MQKLRSRRSCGMLVALFWLPLAAHAAVQATVELPAAAQAREGVVTAPLARAGALDLPDAVATVRDPSALLSAAADLDSARAQVKADAAAARAAEAEARRLRALVPRGYVSRRDVQSADAAAAAARATQTAGTARLAALQADARARWGGALAALAGQGPQALAPFARGDAALVELAWPEAGIAQPPARVVLQQPPAAPVPAQLLGAAPTTDAVVQGASFFYRADDAHLRSGQRLAVSVADHAAGDAVAVPLDAVVWYAGQSWVYVESAPGTFRRTAVTGSQRSGAAWVVRHGLLPGQPVVVLGAELLLTQELKPPPGATPASEDDDDD